MFPFFLVKENNSFIAHSKSKIYGPGNKMVILSARRVVGRTAKISFIKNHMLKITYQDKVESISRKTAS